MNERIIFLDYDGVINLEPTGFKGYFDNPEAIWFLNKLCEMNDNDLTKFVVSYLNKSNLKEDVTIKVSISEYDKYIESLKKKRMLVEDIQDIIEKCNQVKIDIEQDGRVFVMHAELEWIDKAIELIENICREPELNAIYPAKVIKVLEIGAVVEIWPGCEGLVHISNLAWRRVAKVEDEVKEGDEIVVKLIEVGQGGKLRFSRKDTMPKPEKSDNDRPRKPREQKAEKAESKEESSQQENKEE